MKAAGALTAMLSFAALLGLLVQLYAYVSARGFYAPYNVAPDEVDITPFNASLRLAIMSLGAASMLALGAFITLLLIVAVVLIDYSKYLDKWPVSTLARLYRQIVGKATWGMQLCVAIFAVGVLGILIGVGMLTYTIAWSAGFETKNGRPSPSIPSLISNMQPRMVFLDLIPQRVFLKWRNPANCPPLLTCNVDSVFSAQYLGRSGDRYVFYIDEQHLLVRVEGAAVGISSDE